MRYTPPPPPSALNPANQPAYAARLRAALEDALLSAGQDEPGGIQVVRVQTAVHELIRLIAFSAYQSPEMKVPSRLRKWTEEFGRELRWAIQTFQRADAAGEAREMMYVDDAAMEWPK